MMVSSIWNGSYSVHPASHLSIDLIELAGANDIHLYKFVLTSTHYSHPAATL